MTFHIRIYLGFFFFFLKTQIEGLVGPLKFLMNIATRAASSWVAAKIPLPSSQRRHRSDLPPGVESVETVARAHSYSRLRPRRQFS